MGAEGGVTTESLVAAVPAGARNRVELWTTFLDRVAARRVAEIGIFQGAFAAAVLDACPTIERYYMIDPWRPLDGWNKPANRERFLFERWRRMALSATEAHADRREVLRGTTAEVIDEIPDGSLDFAYVDGDHTLRGITIDLIRVYAKVRPGGWIAGDDFMPSVWQHGDEFEPTLVFPFAVYFAEAVGTRIYAIGHNQFLIEAQSGAFEFRDLTGDYGDLQLRTQMRQRG